MSRRIFNSHIRRRQLDRLFSEPVNLRHFLRPAMGWIKEIRTALGMSAAQLGRRLGVRQSSIAKLEESEAEDTISLQSLRRVAEALDCTLVYAIVPNSTLELFLQMQARHTAEQMVKRIEHTMVLEAQGRSQTEQQQEIDELAAELARTLSRDLWDETS